MSKLSNSIRAEVPAAARRKGYPGCFKPGNQIGKEHRFKKQEKSQAI